MDLCVLGLSPLPINALRKDFFAAGGKKNILNSIIIMESNYATQQEIQGQLVRADLNSLIVKLEAYAYSRIKGMGLSIEAIDVVYDVLLGIQREEGGRNWDKSKYPQFDQFLFGAVKSHISNAYKKHKNSKVAESGHLATYHSIPVEMEVVEEIDFAVAKKQALVCLQELGGDAEEECVFECWCDGTTKPQEIAEFFDVPVETVYKATKRLIRKLHLIQERLNYYHP